ncbi:MAG: amidohydrolase [Firmicutes bacterium]|nr:amidohydrolase [Bacillota bacterium]
MTAPIIDFHVHTVYYEQYNSSAIEWIKNNHGEEKWDKIFSLYQDPAHFCTYLQECGIDYAVILAELSPAATGICSNEYVLKFCQGHSSLIPFASINPFFSVDMGSELLRLIDKGFRGLKMYPTYQHFYPNDNTLYPLYAQAERLQIPVMFHTGSSVFRGARLKYGDPLFFDDVAVDFPELNIILVHGGRGFWYDRAFFLSRLHNNVYLEVAGLPPQKLLSYFPELERIADKVLFGSDWPGLSDLKNNIKAIRELSISEEAKEKILGGNAAKLLKIDF